VIVRYAMLSLALALVCVCATGERVVVLDWRCGNSMLHPNLDPEPLDFGSFFVAGGGTLADRKVEFMDAVRVRIKTILDGAGIAVRVEHAPTDAEVETTVRLTQWASPAGKNEIGSAHYDPKNGRHGDEAVIFGEQIRRNERYGEAAGEYTFDDWVAVFANVCSHETLHTLGYGHVPRSECPPDGSDIEIMLDGHTMGEMRSEQRVLDKCR